MGGLIAVKVGLRTHSVNSCEFSAIFCCLFVSVDRAVFVLVEVLVQLRHSCLNVASGRIKVVEFFPVIRCRFCAVHYAVFIQVKLCGKRLQGV